MCTRAHTHTALFYCVGYFGALWDAGGVCDGLEKASQITPVAPDRRERGV